MKTLLTFLKLSDYLTWGTVEITVLILIIIFGFYKLFKQIEEEDKKEQKKKEEYQKERKLEEQKKQEKWKYFLEKENISLILEDEELFKYYNSDPEKTKQFLEKEHDLKFLISFYSKLKKQFNYYYSNNNHIKTSLSIVFEKIQNKFNESIKNRNFNLDLCNDLYYLLIKRCNKDQILFLIRVKIQLNTLLSQELKLIEEKENSEEKIDLLEKLFQKFPDNKKLKLIIAEKINELVKTTQ